MSGRIDFLVLCIELLRLAFALWRSIISLLALLYVRVVMLFTAPHSSVLILVRDSARQGQEMATTRTSKSQEALSAVNCGFARASSSTNATRKDERRNA